MTRYECPRDRWERGDRSVRRAGTLQARPRCQVFDVRSPAESGNTYVEGDVCDVEAVDAAVEGVDAVVHLAGLLPAKCEVDPLLAQRVNVGGTLAVLEAVRGTDTRFVFTSSKAVFGPIVGEYGHPHYTPLSEDVTKSPQDVYGFTNYTAEWYCRRYSREAAVDAVILRFASTFGPGKGDAHGELSLLSHMVEAAAAERP